MTRDAGQVRTGQAALGLVLVILTLTLVIVGLGALLAPGQQVPELDAPAESSPEGQVTVCPDAAELSRPARPPEVAAAMLIECPQAYDGRVVRFTGEAVRAVLLRGDRAWVQLNDDPYALANGPIPEARTTLGGNSGIPVSLPGDVAHAVTHVGNHRTRGDLIEVQGVFRRADPADGGGPAIHADTARIARPGYPIVRTTDPWRGLVAALTSLMAAGTALLARRARR